MSDFDFIDTATKLFMKDCLLEFRSNLISNLRKSNLEFDKLLRKRDQLLDKHPKLNQLLANEYEEIEQLKSDEIKALCEYFDISDKFDDFFEVELFKKGMLEMFYLLKTIGVF